MSALEEAVARSMRAEDDAAGHPGGCDYQAGYYQCPNAGNRYALIPTVRDVGTRWEWGWECRDCSTWYPRVPR